MKVYLWVAQWLRYFVYLLITVAYLPVCCESVPCFVKHMHDKVCQLPAHGWWFSPDTQVSSTSKTDCHDIAGILGIKPSLINQYVEYKEKTY